MFSGSDLRGTGIERARQVDETTRIDTATQLDAPARRLLSRLRAASADGEDGPTAATDVCEGETGQKPSPEFEGQRPGEPLRGEKGTFAPYKWRDVVIDALNKLTKVPTSNNMPADKLANARKKFGIPDWEIIFALYDDTVFRSNKDGVAFCMHGLYWRNLLEKASFVPWDELANLEFSEDGQYLRLGNNLRIGCAWDTLKPKDLKLVLATLKSYPDLHRSFAAAEKWRAEMIRIIKQFTEIPTTGGISRRGCDERRRGMLGERS